MRSRSKGYLTRMPIIVGAVIVSGGLAGVGILNQQSSATSTPLTGVACRYCGIVEQIREVKLSPPHYSVSSVSAGRNQAILMLLSALSGATVADGPTWIYEVSVRMDDGSIRAVRDGRLPKWRLGERVKIIKNQVEPLS
jgi:hypothetical protein